MKFSAEFYPVVMKNEEWVGKKATEEERLVQTQKRKAAMPQA